MRELPSELPAGYYLERDPDVLLLRRADGAVVGAFSARGVAPEAVRQTLEETRAKRWVRPELRTRFFGRFELLCGGEPLPPGRDGKSLAIPKHLLPDRDRPVSQDYLTGWLWPESSLKKARWSLDSAIRALRKLLGPARP